MDLSIDARRRGHRDPVGELDEAFVRDGYFVIRNGISKEHAALLREKTDYYAAHPDVAAKHKTIVRDTFALRYCHQLDPVFAALIDAEPIRKVAQICLGEDAQFNVMSVIRNRSDEGVAAWHLDDVVEFPLPDEIPRFDARIRMPIFWATVQVALSDIDSVEHGPTQVVPGSHYSGRWPPQEEEPQFEGCGPVSILCKAGDIYPTNHQCWHRGA